MTYRQYYVKLITLITNLEDFNEEQYQKLKADHEYLMKEGRAEFKDLQNDLYSVMRKCEKVASLIESQEVKPTDEIDPEKLGFLPVEN